VRRTPCLLRFLAILPLHLALFILHSLRDTFIPLRFTICDVGWLARYMIQGNEHWVIGAAVESKGDSLVELTAAFAAVPANDGLFWVNPAGAAVALEVTIAEHPLPIFPFPSSFNTQASARPAPKDDVSPATI